MQAGHGIVIDLDDGYKTVSTPDGWILCHEVAFGDATLVKRFHNGSFVLSGKGDVFPEPDAARKALEDHLSRITAE